MIGTTELPAVADGYRESVESWGDLLRDLEKRGMQAPVVAIGDVALGFWAAVRDVWPETQEQRCRVHRIANGLDKLPRSVQPKAKASLHEIMAAPTRAAAETAEGDPREQFEAKYPKATASLTTDLERLLTFYDFPAEHWVHLRTTNPVESTVAAVRPSSSKWPRRAGARSTIGRSPDPRPTAEKAAA